MNLQCPSSLFASVAEGVVNPSGLHDERAGWGDHKLAADVKGQLALQNEVALVLVCVGVRRDHPPRREARLDNRKGAIEVLHRHLMGYAQAGKVDAFVRSDENLLLLLGRHGMLPFTSPA